MKKKFIFGMCTFFLLVLFSFTASSVSVGNSWICKGVELVGSYDLGNIPLDAVIDCIDESYKFTTEDEAAFLLVNLLGVVQNDIVSFEVYYPNGSLEANQTATSGADLSSVYVYLIVPIAGESMPLGTYTARVVYKGNVLDSKTFTISEPDYTCENNGYFCCPANKVCMSKPDPKYVCTSGACCTSAASCVPVVSGELTVRVVTDCVAEGLEECYNVIGSVYDYSAHGALQNLAIMELFFRDIDVDCFNKGDVVIAVYGATNFTNSTSRWRTYASTITKLAGNYYSITAQIDYLGYIAIIKSPKCVPTDCFIPGFNTVPFDGMVLVGNPIKLGVCGIAKFCDASADGICDRRCTQDLDPDCTMTCTSATNDCCNPEKDGICDLDCVLGMDPECAYESYLGGLCYPSSSQKRGFASCDIHCTGADPSCTSPSCDPAADEVCNPNCPKLSNGVGYLDVDCCALNGVSVTNGPGDCCNTDKDGVCDPDCIPGLDRDCNINCKVC